LKGLCDRRGPLKGPRDSKWDGDDQKKQDREVSITAKKGLDNRRTDLRVQGGSINRMMTRNLSEVKRKKA